MADQPKQQKRRRRAFEPTVDTGLPDEEALPADRPRGVLGRILSGFLSYGVVVLVFAFLIPKLRSVDVSAFISLITWPQVAVILALGVVNLFTNLPPIVITLPGLRLREAAVTNTASAALSNTVPEGGAVATGLNFAMLRSWGFALSDITSSYLTTGIWTNLVRYGLAAVALVLLVLEGDTAPATLWIAALVAVLVGAAIVLLILVLGSERFALGLGRFIGRLAKPLYRLFRKPVIDDMDERLAAFRIELLDMVRTRWHALTGAMIVSQLTAAFVLGVAVRMQGIPVTEVSWARIYVAYASMALASLIVPTPGGLGVAEVALVAVLGANLPEEYQNQLYAAVTLFRLATWFLPIPIGAGSYLYWRRNRSWRHPESDRVNGHLVAAV